MRLTHGFVCGPLTVVTTDPLWSNTAIVDEVVPLKQNGRKDKKNLDLPKKQAKFFINYFFEIDAF